MERDDLIQDHNYSISANHNEAQGVVIRKKIWKVTGILTLITIVEVLIGAFIKQYDLWVKTIFFGHMSKLVS